MQDTLEVADSIQPITTYEQWKAKALHLGTKLEVRTRSRGNHPKTKADGKLNGKSKSNKGKSGEARKDKDKATAVVQVPKSEKERHMKNGECVKCGKAGHIGKECRTGWKYNAAAAPATPAGLAVTVIKEKKKRAASTQQNQSTEPQKRRLADQPDGRIKTIAPRIEELSDSGNE